MKMNVYVSGQNIDMVIYRDTSSWGKVINTLAPNMDIFI